MLLLFTSKDVLVVCASYARIVSNHWRFASSVVKDKLILVTNTRLFRIVNMLLGSVLVLLRKLS